MSRQPFGQARNDKGVGLFAKTMQRSNHAIDRLQVLTLLYGADDIEYLFKYSTITESGFEPAFEAMTRRAGKAKMPSAEKSVGGIFLKTL
ncbi:MAG: hypothetical protein IJG45_08595 [Oscillospiraceae bacterium]|nr:hypothetical protein [Oscillospiraceae bacterium]